ncbi:DUF305 domain-containing protein [Streptomyces sp. NRRL S-340]|uniref:DUF305 domain-containing protein n=1 Tax=Streptomyces sp. NRRL S-340 TaxID=1463901 RepID=UPI00068C8018|nr:DUF305 domain-containing protein [Streptomyces sp. NRRL S-340]
MATRLTTHRFRLRSRRTAAAAAAVTAALVLAACGGGSGTSAPAHSAPVNGSTAHPSAAPSAGRGGHNAQDVTFAQEMIPHHRQAVAMAALVPTRAASQQVKDLATRIRKAQDPEIAAMTGWLKAWGATVPSADAGATGMTGMPGMDHSGSAASGHSASPMPGMMSDAGMSELAKLSGKAFDRAFLRMMVDHHAGAVAMARTERDKGADSAATALAESVITSQSAEIAEMRKALAGR